MLLCVSVSREFGLFNVVGLSFAPRIACKSVQLATKFLGRILRGPV
jgi:hypothetical protein